MPEILGRVRGALMLDRPVKTVKTVAKTLIAKGPITAVYTGVETVWNNMGQRIDHVAGTQIAQGGRW